MAVVEGRRYFYYCYEGEIIPRLVYHKILVDTETIREVSRYD